MESRRGLLKKTVGGAAILAVAGAVPIALRRTKLREVPAARPLLFFTAAEYSIWAAVAERILAAAPGAPEPLASAPGAAQLDVAGKADAFFALLPEDDGKQMKQLIALFDNALFSFVTGGPATPFTQLDAAAQDAQLHAWATSRIGLRRTGFQAMKRLCCAIYFGQPQAWASAHYPGPPDVSAVRAALDAAESQKAAMK
jgi:hypothetical protein